MKKLVEKDRFICALLESDELQTFFDAKYISYKDDNQEVDHNRVQVLQAMEHIGPAYYSHIFNDVRSRAVVLFNPQNEIVGSAEIDFVDTNYGTIPEGQGAHVLSQYRGQGLSQMLYQARFKYLKEHTTFKEFRVIIGEYNKASQGAAKSAGLYNVGKNERGNLIFERRL